MPAGVSAWTPLANITLAGAQATVTFSSISNAYADLFFVIGNVKSSTNTAGINVKFNGDSAANYYYVYAIGNGGSATTSNQTGQTSMVLASNVVPDTTNPGQILFHLMNYSNTSNVKGVLVRTDFPSTTFSGTQMIAGHWSNNSAVTTVQFALQSAATFAAGTTFALYGVS